MAVTEVSPPVGDKGLKKDALGFVSSVVIGVASTAPGYSLAASLGFVVAIAGVGLQAPAVLLVAFIPMLLIASAYYYMNRADPDCGTTFAWVTKAMGPSLGWMGGWAIVVADVIVMANLAQIAGLYSFLLFDWQTAADSVVAVTAVGIVWIAIMTAITTIGIELSAKRASVMISAPSRPTCVRAESSMPITQIAVMTAIHTTPTNVTASVDAAALSQPTSRNE